MRNVDTKYRNAPQVIKTAAVGMMQKTIRQVTMMDLPN